MVEDSRNSDSTIKDKRNNDAKKRLPAKDSTKNNEHQPSKKKNRKEVAIFGNYRNYYGYRVGNDLDEDPRLKVMKGEWFEGKDCLDIGCNSGLITISIAKKFGCGSILGVDIDGARIQDAYSTLKSIMNTGSHKMISKTQGSADEQISKGSENHENHSLTKVTKDSPPEETKDLFKIVSFQKGNFVQGWRPPPNTHYHVILCLSVSKWIHLNWGDEGLITLFWRVWTHLHPGGVFILEPQPWSSYYNNRLVSDVTAANYKKIEVPPEDFQDVLLDKIGFRRVEDLTSSLSGTKSGFDRPILAFWK